MNLRAQLKEILLQVDKIGGDARPLILSSPVEELAIKLVEQKLGYQLPVDFRNVLSVVSGKCKFIWFLPDDLELPYTLREVFSGRLEWDIDTLLTLEEARAGWASEVFPNSSDEYDKVWYNKLVFQEVGNGDYLAIDLDVDAYGKIIYLSHDCGEGHGYVMADSFTGLLNKWSMLGCVGAEDWQWLPFCKDKYSGIDPNCENAQLWKRTLGFLI